MSAERAIDLTTTGRRLYRVRVDDPTISVARSTRHVLTQRIAPNGTPINVHWQAAPALVTSDERTSLTQSTRELVLSGVTQAHPATSELEAVRDARVAVLARKYENPESAEHEARFKLLTEKLRALEPRLGEHEHAALAKSAALLEGSAELIAAIKRNFGV